MEASPGLERYRFLEEEWESYESLYDDRGRGRKRYYQSDVGGGRLERFDHRVDYGETRPVANTGNIADSIRSWKSLSRSTVASFPNRSFSESADIGFPNTAIRSSLIV